MRSKSNTKGFTLIELLIVITIIGILAVAFLPSLLGAPSRARDTQRLASMNKLQSFFNSESLTSQLPADSGCLDPTTITAGTASQLINNNLADIGGVFPVDPNNTAISVGPSGSATDCTGNFVYVRFGSGNDYTAAVVAAVENEENGNIDCADAALEDASNTAPTLDDTGTCFAALVQ